MREVPFDIEAEEAAVAACLLNPKAIPDIASEMRPSDCYRDVNAWTFAAILAVHAREGDRGVNQITVSRELGDRLPDVGGVTYLMDIVRRCPSSVGAEFYARIVKRLSTYRTIISAASAVQEMAYSAPDDLPSMLDRAMAMLNEVSGVTERGMTAGEVAYSGGLHTWIEAHMADPRKLQGISSGVEALDWLLDGWQRGMMYVLAAETSAGKSLFAHNQVRHLSGAGHRIAVFSSEMGNRSVGKRLVYLQAGVDPLHVRKRGYYLTEERDAVEEAATWYESQPITHFPGSFTASSIRAECRRLKSRDGLDVVVIDHIDHVGGGTANRTAELETLIRDVKSMAIDLDVIVLCISHLSRATVNGKMARLKNSSAKEQDADAVLFIQPVRYVGGVKQEMTSEEAAMEKANQNWLNVDLEIYKNREGLTGVVEMVMNWNQGGRYYERASA